MWVATKIVPHDVLILELFEQTDLSNGSTRDAFVFCFQPNLLEGDDFVRGYITGLVNDAVSSWENDGGHWMLDGQDDGLKIPSPVGWDMGQGRQSRV